MSDHYMYPGELAALLAFLFAPPLLVALTVQAWLFAARGMFRRHTARAVIGLMATILGGAVGGTAVLLASPPFPSSVLGVTDVALGGRHLPILPLGFITVGVAAPVATWWALRAA